MRAASVNLGVFLQAQGEKLVSSGRDKRLASDHSVTIRGSKWYDHAKEEGGNAISFVKMRYNLGYAEAVAMLLESGSAVPSKPIEKHGFALPPANIDMRRVFAYLVKHRKIEREILAAFVRAKLIYEDAEHHNIVFVGLDEAGIPRHAHKRSTNSQGKSFRQNVEGSDPKYSFNYVGMDGSLYVFEAPVDMLSFISLHQDGWKFHSYVACCGTSIQPVIDMLRRQPEIDTVYLCLDNDRAGQTAAKRMEKQLRECRLHVEILVPTLKDWSDDLMSMEVKLYIQT